jgi:hypothetical protein
MAPILQGGASEAAVIAQRMFEGFAGIFGSDKTNTAQVEARANSHIRDPAEFLQKPKSQFDSVAARPQEIEGQFEYEEPTEREVLMDKHVAYFLRKHPEAQRRHHIVKVRPAVYNVNGREINVDWQYSETPGEQGFLLAIDGPLRQPFADYMAETEANMEFDDKRLGRSSLQQIPKGKRLSFGDSHKAYTRLEAMKVAKEQALVREMAADYVKDGVEVPQRELMLKYKKVISQKLGGRQRRPEQPLPAPEAISEVDAPAPPIVAPPPVAAPVSLPPPPPTAQKARQQQTHGSPVYCTDHNRTEKRKKMKPQQIECCSCRTLIQTNYVDFLLCPDCSQKEHRCMCCGNAAEGEARAMQIPARKQDDSTHLQYLATHPMASQNHMASQNVLASYNVIAPMGSMWTH